jgi:hypothetical protein
MPTLFDKLKTWLPGQAAQVAGVTVTYTRGGTTRTLSALEGRTVFASQQEGAPRIEFGDRDYLIELADLTAFGDPQIGDRITETLAGVQRVFEVRTPGTGEPAWRWSDPGHTRYRVHTTRVQ